MSIRRCDLLALILLTIFCLVIYIERCFGDFQNKRPFLVTIMIFKLSIISILRLKFIALKKKNLINVSLLFCVKPSKTTSFHQERH